MLVDFKDIIVIDDGNVFLKSNGELLGRFLISNTPVSVKGRNTNIVVIKDMTVVLESEEKIIFADRGRLLIRMFRDTKGREQCLTLELKVGKRLFNIQEILENYEGKLVRISFSI